MKWRVLLVAVAIGFAGLAFSCLNTDNPGGLEDIYMGYPFFCLNTSRSLLVSFPPIPLMINVLWAGFLIDLMLYSSAGFVVSYLVFSLRENMRLLSFLIKSGAVFFAGSFIVLSVLWTGSPSPYLTVSPVFIAGGAAFFISLMVAPAATILYGYYRLFKKRKTQQAS